MDYQKKYSLIKEHDDHFEVHDDEEKVRFNVAKRGVHPATQIKIMKLKKFSEGGEVEPRSEDLEEKLGEIPPQVARQLASEESKNMFLPELDFGRLSDNRADAEHEGLLDALGFGQDKRTGEDLMRQRLAMTGQMPEPFNPALPLPSPQLGQPQGPVGMIDPGDIGGVGTATLPDAPMPTAQGKPGTQGQAPGSGVGAGGMGLGQLQGYMDQFKRATMAEANAQGQQNLQMAQIYDDALKAQEAQALAFQAKEQEYLRQNDELSKAIIDHKIDPDRFWASKTTGSKVGATIAMILGGIGSGMSGQPNQGLAMFNKQWDADIDAQKTELGKKQTLLSDNYRKLGNLQASEQLTRVQMAAITQGKLAKMAAQTNNPIIQARAQQQIAQIGMSIAPMMAQLAQFDVQKQAVTQAVQSGNTGAFINAAVPKHLQKDAYEELGALRGYQSSVGKVQELFNRAKELSVIQSKNPLSDTSAELASINAQLTGYIRANMRGQGTITDQDQILLIDPYLPTSRDLVNQSRLAIKMKGMISSLGSKMASATPILKESLGQYGLPLPGIGTATPEGGDLIRGAKRDGSMPGLYKRVQGGLLRVGD